MTDVDFVINVFERTYREVLQPGQINARAGQHQYPFRKKVVLVNNVNDRGEVERLLAPLLSTGEITAFHYVADRLDEALRQTGLSRKLIGQTIHYTDCAIVAVTLPGSPYLLYCDTDVFLQTNQDWVTPSLALMQKDPRIAVANPAWTPSTLPQETRHRIDNFALGYGFSDQIFLLRRQEFARPIYQFWSVVSWRYPLSEIAPLFEQRVDAYMRQRRRLRATYTPAQYRHEGDEGAGYRKMSLFRRWKRRCMQQMVRIGQLLPGNHPCYHI